MKPGAALTRFALDHPWAVALLMGAVALSLALLAALPSIWPDSFPSLNGVAVDTDPENMLSREEPVRVFHNKMKRLLSLNDIVVVGIVNETHPNGVFNPRSLQNIHALTEYALTLKGAAIGESDPEAGVISADVIAPSTVDNIEQGGAGEIKFEWLMPKPPETDEEALAIRDKARRIPFLDGTLVSEDGQAIALYLPLTAKNLSYEVYSRLRAKIAEFDGDDHYYITGLPVANDVFGAEMFVQMAISAPMAMAVVFLLLLLFFRKLALIISPMVVALVAVICTMSALVITGNTIHIMSSMIPIFIMPIAVLDSIHILSEFFDRYQQTRDRRKTLTAVMETLFAPMLYTSLTSSAGFASLALTPIPPIQVFGIFVALGIMLAWFLTITFIPAYIMLLSEKRLENFGASQAGDDAHSPGWVERFLGFVGHVAYRRTRTILALSVAAAVAAGVGISQIQINDNPIKWFKKSHDIRVADRILNEHFSGTYMAYLTLRLPETWVGETPGPILPDEIQPEPAAEPALPAGLGGAPSEPALPTGLEGAPPKAPEAPPAPEDSPSTVEIFKEPDALRYIAALQEHLLTTGAVGKSNSLADIVKTVHRELIDGSPGAYRIPDTRPAVAQCLMQYQSSHRPQDLWHLVTPDFSTTSIWVQLKSGDNKDMARVVAAIDAYITANPPSFSVEGLDTPITLEHNWFGLTYVNVIWQDKMVSGMLQAFLGSFLVVLLMMILLFRSGLWGLLSMIPLTITIGLIYGAIGFIGKDYDMPVAVLSSLTLGLAVDFAIHFLARARALYAEHGSWEKTHVHVFGEPARAIARNVVVIAVGFLPLVLTPLVPYITVGVFLAVILLVSGAGTLLILPALIRLLEPWLFPRTRGVSIASQCGTCILTGVTALLLVWVNLRHFVETGSTTLTVACLALLPVLAVSCILMARREKYRTEAGPNPEEK